MITEIERHGSVAIGRDANQRLVWIEYKNGDSDEIAAVSLVDNVMDACRWSAEHRGEVGQ